MLGRDTPHTDTHSGKQSEALYEGEPVEDDELGFSNDIQLAL